MKHSMFKIRALHPKDKEYSSSAYPNHSPFAKIEDSNQKNAYSSKLNECLEYTIQLAKNLAAEARDRHIIVDAHKLG